MCPTKPVTDFVALEHYAKSSSPQFVACWKAPNEYYLVPMKYSSHASAAQPQANLSKNSKDPNHHIHILSYLLPVL